MGEYQVSISEVIPAPPARDYAILKDYHQDHPAILQYKYLDRNQQLGVGRRFVRDTQNKACLDSAQHGF